MYYCWDKDPQKRPSFAELVSLLDNILCSQNDYIELDRFPDHGYYNILKPGTTGEKLWSRATDWHTHVNRSVNLLILYIAHLCIYRQVNCPQELLLQFKVIFYSIIQIK